MVFLFKIPGLGFLHGCLTNVYNRRRQKIGRKTRVNTAQAHIARPERRLVTGLVAGAR